VAGSGGVFAARLARRGPTAPAADPVAFWETIEGRRCALDAVVPLEAREVAAIRRTAQEAWGIYKRVAPLVRAFPDEGLVALGLPAVAHDVVRLEDLRAGETLVAWFDLLGENGTYRVVELNAETPFFLVESFVENGRRARAAGYGDPNAGELERLGDAFHAALQPLALGARIGVVASNVYREDVGTALFLRDVIAARVAAQTVFVPVHELAIPAAGSAMPPDRSTSCIAAILSSILPPIGAAPRCLRRCGAARAACSTRPPHYRCNRRRRRR
jgi:glutathionylspermidine synthase